MYNSVISSNGDTSRSCNSELILKSIAPFYKLMIKVHTKMLTNNKLQDLDIMYSYMRKNHNALLCMNSLSNPPVLVVVTE